MRSNGADVLQIWRFEGSQRHKNDRGLFTCLFQVLCCRNSSFLQPLRKRLQTLGWRKHGSYPALGLHWPPELGVHIRQPDNTTSNSEFLICQFGRKKALFFPDILSDLDVWWNGRSSLWYSVEPQQVWTLTFNFAQTSFTLLSTFSSSEVTWKDEAQR